MRQRYGDTAGCVTQPEPSVFGISRTDVRSISDIRLTLRDIFPNKTASEVALRTGMTVRTAEYWLAGRSGLSGPALASLLRSDIGLDVLAGIMGNDRPSWWRDFRRKVEIGRLIREQDDLERRLDALKRE